MLKRNEKSITVDLKPEIPQKKKVKDQFEKVLELAKVYDRVFWVVDFDVIVSETREAKTGAKTPLQELKEYCSVIDAKHDDISVIINNPCLEYWLLLHFEPIAKYFKDCDSAAKQLSKHLNDYQKTQNYYTKQNQDIYLKLKPHLVTAVENARKLGEFDFDYPFSGMTQMYLLFEEVGLIEKTKAKK